MTPRWLLLTALLLGCSTDDAITPQRSAEPSEPTPTPTPVVVKDEPSVTPRRATPCDGPAATLRTLIVGNSQIYFWDLPRLVSELSTTAPPGCPRIAAEGFTSGGQNLERLWRWGDSRGRDLETVIREGKYDVVVLAESIDLLELEPPYTRFVTFANLIIDAARASGARPVIYATPYADQDEHRGFLEMAEPQVELGRDRGVNVAAGGLAWLRVWQALPEIDLHHPDHAHPGWSGSVISAMVIYAVITRASSLPLTPTQSECEARPGEREPCPPISDAELDVFRHAAWAEAAATGNVSAP